MSDIKEKSKEKDCNVIATTVSQPLTISADSRLAGGQLGTLLIKKFKLTVPNAGAVGINTGVLPYLEGLRDAGVLGAQRLVDRVSCLGYGEQIELTIEEIKEK